MRNAKRKKAQRKANKIVRQMNYQFQNDDFILQCGDFELRQTDYYWEVFSDGSGGSLNIVLQLTERRSDKTWENAFFGVDYGFFGWKLFEWVNNIVGEFV